MIVLLLILIAAVYTDYKQNRIPNWISIFGVLSGLLISFIHGGVSQCLAGMGGMILPVFVLYPIFKIGGMGAGDLKLFAVAGSYLGIKGITISFIIAFITGAIISLLKMLFFQNFKERIYYFISYMADIFLKGKWRIYEMSEEQLCSHNKDMDCSLKFPQHKIHFALPILIGVIFYLGGSL